MDLDTLMIAVFCLVDEAIPQLTGGHRLRERGPEPILVDSAVLTREMVGEYLGLAQDTALFAYFLQHYAHVFPALLHLRRTTFVRQAANLWRVKERLWQEVLSSLHHDEHFAMLGSFPLPVCHFARAYRCRRLRAEAAFGKDTLVRQTFYGLRSQASAPSDGSDGVPASHGSHRRPCCTICARAAGCDPRRAVCKPSLHTPSHP